MFTCWLTRVYLPLVSTQVFILTVGGKQPYRLQINMQVQRRKVEHHKALHSRVQYSYSALASIYLCIVTDNSNMKVSCQSPRNMSKTNNSRIPFLDYGALFHVLRLDSSLQIARV